MHSLHKKIHTTHDSPCVGDVAELGTTILKEIAYGIRRIVTDGEGGDCDGSDGEWAAGLDIGEPGGGSRHSPQILSEITGAVDVQFVFFGKDAQTAGVIGMFVRKEYTGKVAHSQTALGKPFANARGADSGVYQQMGATGRDDGGIALTAAGKRGESDHLLFRFVEVELGFNVLGGELIERFALVAPGLGMEELRDIPDE